MRSIWLAVTVVSLLGALLPLWHFHLSPNRGAAATGSETLQFTDKPTGSLFITLALIMQALVSFALATAHISLYGAILPHNNGPHLPSPALGAVALLIWTGFTYESSAASPKARALAALDCLLCACSVAMLTWWLLLEKQQPLRQPIALAGQTVAVVASLAGLATIFFRFPMRSRRVLIASSVLLVSGAACECAGFALWWCENADLATIVATLWGMGALAIGFGTFLDNHASYSGLVHDGPNDTHEIPLMMLLPCVTIFIGLWHTTFVHHGRPHGGESWWAPLLLVAAGLRLLYLWRGEAAHGTSGELITKNQQLQETVKRRTTQLSALHAITAELNDTLDSEKLIVAALSRIKESVGADAAAMWLKMNEASGIGGADTELAMANASALLREMERGASERRALDSLKLGRDEFGDGSNTAGAAPREVEERRWRTVRDMGENPVARDILKKMRARLEEGDIADGLAFCENECGTAHVAAIQWKGEIIGALGVVRLNGVWDDAEYALLNALAIEIGVSLQNAQLYQETSRLADRDSLTDLLNHRALQGQLIAILSRARRIPTEFSIVMMDVKNFQFFNETYGHAVGDRVLRTVAQCLRDACRTSDVLGRFGGDEFVAILMDTDTPGTTEVCNRIARRLEQESFQVSGDGRRIPIGLSFGASLHPQDGAQAVELIGIANTNLQESKTSGKPFVITDKAAQSQELRELKDVSVGGSFGVLDALVTAIDNKDRYTRRHSEDVSRWATLMSQQLGHDDEMQRAVRICGLLHDVGKIAVPDAILRKPGRLNDDEFNIMQQHPVFGALIVKDVPNLTEVLGGIRHHHERYDGRGYPDKLAGEDIPLLGRMLAVPDCFSAMTTERPYRKALTWAEAISEIEKGCGTQFDTVCADAFLEVIARIVAEQNGPNEPAATPNDDFGETIMRPRSVADAAIAETQS